MKAETNVRAATAAGNPTDPTPVQLDDQSDPVTAEQFFAMLAEYDEANAAYAAEKTEEDDGPAETRYRAAHSAMTWARPSDPRAVLAHARWWIEEERSDTCGEPPSPIVVRAVEALDAALLAPYRNRSGVEDALRDVRAVTVLLDTYYEHRDDHPETWEERNRDHMQLNYLLERLVAEVHDLEIAFYGFSLTEPAKAPATDGHELWQEFKAAAASAEAAHDEDGRIDSEGPEWRRFMAARDALADARPTDAAGLAAQVKFYVDLHAQGCDPNEDQEAMLAHVGAQLEAMASAPGEA